MFINSKNSSFFIILILIFGNRDRVLAQGNNRFIGLNINAPFSFMDLPTKIGIGTSISYIQSLNHDLNLVGAVGINAFRAGGKSDRSTSEIYCKGFYGEANLSLRYEGFDRRHRDFYLAPDVGFSVIYFNSEGGFDSSQKGMLYYNLFPEPYLHPVISSNNSSIENAKLKGSGFTSALSVGLNANYKLNYENRLVIRVGYLFMLSDLVDGYFLPVQDNQHNDVFFNLSIGWVRDLN